jgi:steroid delta-isomerase-like uncharacterized protein
MTTEENKDFMHRFLEASIGTDTTAFKELMAPDFVAHVNGGPTNRDGFVQHMGRFNLAFSDWQITVSDLVADAEKVVARTTWQGIHSGNFMGLPPTGKQVEIEAYIVERLKDGKSVEHWSLFDQLSMLQQLGLVPPPQGS